MGVGIWEGKKAEQVALALENIVDTISDNYVLYDAIETSVSGHAGLSKMKLILNIVIPKKYKAKITLDAYTAHTLTVYLVSFETNKVIGIETFSVQQGVNTIQLKNRYQDNAYICLTCEADTLIYVSNGVNPVKFNTTTATLQIGSSVTPPSGTSGAGTFKMKVDVFGPMTSVSGSGGGNGGSLWEGQKANFIGDSITRGSFTSADTQSGIASPTFVDIVQQTLGFAMCRNYGVNATSISGTTSQSSSDAFVNRYTNMDDDADAVFVCGGTNDYGTNVVLGTVADTTDISFYGALDVLCRGLIEKYLGKRIVFVTPIPRQTETANSAGATLDDYRKAIFDIARDRYGLAVIDGKTLGISVNDATFKTAYIYDGLHPTQLGHNLMGKSLSHIISAI